MTNNPIYGLIRDLFPDNQVGEITAQDMRAFTDGIWGDKNRRIKSFLVVTDIFLDRLLYENDYLVVTDDEKLSGLYKVLANQPTGQNDLQLIASTSQEVGNPTIDGQVLASDRIGNRYWTDIQPAGDTAVWTVNGMIGDVLVTTENVIDLRDELDTKFDGNFNVVVQDNIGFINTNAGANAANIIKSNVYKPGDIVGFPEANAGVTIGAQDQIISILGDIYEPLNIRNSTAIRGYAVQSGTGSNVLPKNLISRANIAENTPPGEAPGYYNNEVILGDSDIVSAIRSTDGFEPVIRHGVLGTTYDSKIATEKDLENFFTKNEYLTISAGPSSTGKPIVLNVDGYIDSSMLEINAYQLISEYNPSQGVEYPPTDGTYPGWDTPEFGDFFIVTGVDALLGYIFTTGDLTGTRVDNGDFMVWALSGWIKVASEINPSAYYNLDGTYSIRAPFQAGGNTLTNVGNPSGVTDAVPLGYMLGITNLFASKNYVDLSDTALQNQINDNISSITNLQNGKVDKSGSNLTGALFYNSSIDQTLMDDAGLVSKGFMADKIAEIANYYEPILSPVTDPIPELDSILFADGNRGNYWAPKDSLVQSVNNKTGVVNLDAQDVGAAWENHGHTISEVQDLQGSLDSKEVYLGVPTTDGDVLTSLIDGTKSWKTFNSGTVSSVNNILPDTSGNIRLLAVDVGAAPAEHIHEVADVTGLSAQLNDRFRKDEHISSGLNPANAGSPIILNVDGQIDSSLLSLDAFNYVGLWTPTAGNEYPPTANLVNGFFYLIDGLGIGNTYTFIGGDLIGLTVKDSDQIIWNGTTWDMVANDTDNTLYYRLDGTTALTAPFAGGNQIISNIADGLIGTDAASISQISNFVDKTGDTITGTIVIDSGTASQALLKVSRGTNSATINDDYFELSNGINDFNIIRDDVNGGVDVKINDATIVTFESGVAPMTPYQPTDTNHLTRKDYVDAQLGNVFPTPVADNSYLLLDIDGTTSTTQDIIGGTF